MRTFSSELSEAPKVSWVTEHTQRLLNSFEKFLGYPLLTRSGNVLDDAQRLFAAPFVVVSHDTRADPMLNYGNAAALRLWETDFATFTTLPSRLTAEPVHQDARAHLLARVHHHGYIDDYQGVRISTRGKRFHIAQAIIWNLLDESGAPCGQAAMFSRHHEL